MERGPAGRTPHHYVQTEQLSLTIHSCHHINMDEEEDSQEEEKQPLAVIPYVSGVSERIRKACEKFILKVVFRSGCSLFTKVKDPLPKEKLEGVVYKIPCQCGKVYVQGNVEALGNTGKRTLGCMQ